MQSRQVSAVPGDEGPTGRSLYAVGDIHGRIDLLERLYAALFADAAACGGPPPKLVFLGDYIDRGPASDQVIEFVRSIPPSQFDVVALLGNHEAALLEFLDNPSLGPDWSRHGGRDTLLAYGITPPESELDWIGAADALSEALPMEHLSFIRSLRYTYEWGDYFFCHAGVDPARPLTDQDPEDLLWIREPFLGHTRPLEKIIVHGHTITDAVYSDTVRIGLDTGAYRTDKLSAIRLDRPGGRVLFSTNPLGTTKNVCKGETRVEPAAKISAGSSSVPRRLEALGRRIEQLAGSPWPEETRGDALSLIVGLEQLLEQLGGLNETNNPGGEPPLPSPPEAPEILSWLQSIGVSLPVVLGNHLSGPALRAARSGDAPTALSVVHQLAPASIRRVSRGLHQVTEMQAMIDRFLEKVDLNRTDSVKRLSDDVLRLALFLRATLASH